MAKPRILVVGSANMDIVFSVPRVPNKGESIVAENYNYVPGGKGANAVTAVRLLIFINAVWNITPGTVMRFSALPIVIKL